ncbi:MAG: hypothetical protein ACRDA8_19170, partial [Shewanella sp.]
MPIKSFSLTLLSCVCLMACSSSPIDTAELAGLLKDKLSTHIEDDGLKLFTYQARLVDNRARSHDLREPMAASYPPRYPTEDPRQLQRHYQEQAALLELWEQQVELGLSKTLEMTNYCREGYFELSRNISEDKGEIRGECKEGASEAD